MQGINEAAGMDRHHPSSTHAGFGYGPSTAPKFTGAAFCPSVMPVAPAMFIPWYGPGGCKRTKQFTRCWIPKPGHAVKTGTIDTSWR